MRMILLLASMFLALFASAQNIATDKLDWRSISTANVTAGTARPEVCILTTTSTSVEWKKEDGTVMRAFVVDKLLSSWRNVAATGIAQFILHDKAGGAQAIFERKDGVLKATIVIDGTEPESYEFEIEAVEKN